jgi:hypothetical protein
VRYVNELSTMSVNARLSRAPATLRYRIVDIDNQRTALDWVTLAAAASVTFTVPATANAIYMDSRGRKRKTERRVLVIQADASTDNQFNNEIEYAVRNLKGFESVPA